MKCSNCQTENREGVKFCEECGSKLELLCPGCGAKIPLGKKFCGECGQSLDAPKETKKINYSAPQSYTPKHLADKILTTRTSIEGERKLVTVLFADVANFTNLSSKLDPEEVHQIMDGCFKVLMDEIHRYEGTINQFTGDGVMALFGAPVAHEDHAQRACHAALAIQKAMGTYGRKVAKDFGTEFKIRIGINSGPVVVGPIGDDLRMDYTAVGDTTNLASRLEGMARPKTILVSKDTYRLARDFFRFEPLGKLPLKGKEEPHEAFELIKAGGVTTRIGASVARGLTRFVGRKNSMAALFEAYEKATAGSGQVVGVVGEAGVGKSRLLLELRKGLPQEEFSYLEGRCLHYGRSMAYLPLLDILRSCFDIKESDQERIIKKKIAEKIAGFDSRLNARGTCFHDLLSLKVEDQAYLRLEPQQRRERTFEAIRDLVIHLSLGRVVVIAIEDLHWVDKTSEGFLDYLIGWLPNARILLILLYRPEYTHPWGSKSYYNRIGVDKLTIQSSGELVQAILEGADVEPALKGLILNRAVGNPLFMEEFAHTLLENGSIERRENCYVLNKRPSDIQVPDTIQGIIAARMDRLEESLKRIMQVASVIGREFAFRILQSITGMREGLKSHLLNLQGLEFIHEKTLFPELEYIFKHALTQEVAYNSLLVQRRKEIHGKIGRAIEEIYPERREELCDILAHHYVLSDHCEKAVEYLDLANQKAARVHALQEAMAHFEKAMEILDTLPETQSNQERRIILLVNQLFVFQLLFKMSEYHDFLTRYGPMALALSDQKLLGMFYQRIGVCEWWFGHLDQCIESVTRSCELLEAAGEKQELALAYMSLQWSHLWKGDFTRVFALKEAAFRLIEKERYPRSYVLVLTGASWAHSHVGKWDKAVEEAQAALTLGDEYSIDSLVSFSAFALSVAYTLKGDLAKALEYGELGVKSAPTPADKVWAQTGLVWAHSRLGDPVKGVAFASNVVSMYRAVRFVPAEIYVIIGTGEAYLRSGDRDAAVKMLREGLELAEGAGMRFLIGQGYKLLGEAVMEANPTQAGNHLKKAIAVYQEIGAENELAMAYAGYGRYCRLQDNDSEARNYLKKALEIFERLGTMREPEKVREELNRLPGVS